MSEIRVMENRRRARLCRTKTTLRVAAYCRVSTLQEEQADSTKHNASITGA